MNHDKRCTLSVEVPTKRPKFTDLLIDAGIQGLKRAANTLADSLTRDNDNSHYTEVTVNVPKITTSSEDGEQVDNATEGILQEEIDKEE